MSKLNDLAHIVLSGQIEIERANKLSVDMNFKIFQLFKIFMDQPPLKTGLDVPVVLNTLQNFSVLKRSIFVLELYLFESANKICSSFSFFVIFLARK